MSSPITTLIFDCFGVVYAPVLSNWYKAHNQKTGFTDKHLLETFRKFDLDLLSEADIAGYFSKYEGVTSTKEEVQSEIDGYAALDEALLALIRELKDKGLKTVLLSNGNHAFFERKIYPSHPQFKSCFDEIIISSLVGMVKPNADVFLHTLEKIGSLPGESLFIDDNEQNVNAAIKLDMKGFLYRDLNSLSAYLKTQGIPLD